MKKLSLTACLIISAVFVLRGESQDSYAGTDFTHELLHSTSSSCLGEFKAGDAVGSWIQTNENNVETLCIYSGGNVPKLSEEVLEEVYETNYINGYYFFANGRDWVKSVGRFYRFGTPGKSQSSSSAEESLPGIIATLLLGGGITISNRLRNRREDTEEMEEMEE